MKVIVIGGDGFIGRAIVDSLRQQQVFVSVLSDGREGEGYLDIRNRKDVIRLVADADAVFHFGGVLGTSELNENPYFASMSNIIGTLNILDAIKINNIKLLVYPTKPDIWFNAYTITKRCSADFVKLYKEYNKIDCRTILLRNVYGPGQKSSPVRKLFPHIMECAISGQSVDVYGTGLQPVDLVYVKDVAEIASNYFTADIEGTPPIETGRVIRLSVIQLIECVSEILGVKLKYRLIPMRQGESQNMMLPPVGDHTLVKYLNIDSKPYDFESAVKETYSYFLSNSCDGQGLL